MKPTAIVFDIGNVLLPFDFDRAMKKILVKCDDQSPEKLATVLNSKDALESGKIDAGAFFGALRHQFGYRGSDAELESAWQDIFTPNEPMWRFVEEVGDNLPLYLLSNTNEPHVRHIFGSYPVFSLFRDAVYSHEAKCCKPGEEIYRIAERRFQLTPSTTLFLDDLPENVATSRKLGWDALIYDFRNHGTFLESMRERNIL